MTAVAAAQSTPRPLAAYLRRATWGLPAARRQELWGELEEHILTHADHLCAFGTPYELALAQAISEMGPPAKVSAGMTEVYLMPKILISVGAAALALGATFFALAGGGGPVTVPGLSIKLAAPVCLNNSLGAQSGTHVRALQEQACNPLLTGGADAQLAVVGLNDLKRVFNENGIAARLMPSGDLEVRYAPRITRVLTRQLNIGGQGYTQASNLITSVLGSTFMPVLQISGFNNPMLDFGKFKLQLGNAGRPVGGAIFYQDLAPIFLAVLKGHSRDRGWSISFTTFYSGHANVEHVLQTRLKPGEVVIMTYKTSLIEGREDTFTGDVALVAQDGTATFHSDQAHFRFVTDPAQLSSKASNGRVNALLLRVTNIPLRDLRSGILTPAQPTSDAR